MVENEVRDSRKDATHKITAESCKSTSMVIKVKIQYSNFYFFVGRVEIVLCIVELKLKSGVNWYVSRKVMQ